mmetsp:Transcript_8193/g.23088  ORF Transcript_8193/g.23088 Transcript_8193/m.23088 type:complete len:448 (-) Transcript_8193:56-1399(-)
MMQAIFGRFRVVEAIELRRLELRLGDLEKENQRLNAAMQCHWDPLDVIGKSLPFQIVTSEQLQAMMADGGGDAGVEGGFGTVARGHMSGSATGGAKGPVAVKLPAQGSPEDAARRFLREFRAHSILPRDENLVHAAAVCFPSLALVFPWAGQGTLWELLRTEPPNPADGFQLLLGVARGLRALHEQRLTHCDVRSAAVLLFEGDNDVGTVAKLGGCGWVRRVDDEGANALADTIVGDPEYMDPALLLRGPCTQASDVFSLGVVALEVLLGRPAVQPSEMDIECLLDLDQPPPTATRRPRSQHFWLQFCHQLSSRLESPGHAAAALVQKLRPRPDWSRDALLIASGFLVEALQEDAAMRPRAAEAADSLAAAWLLQSTHVAEPRRRTCVVCMDAQINTELHPCRHSALCDSCAAPFVGNRMPCPICRKAVCSYSMGNFDSTFSPSCNN